MASVNKVILVGNCGRDPEIRYLPDGRAVANVSIATTSRRKDRNTGEVIEDTQWHRVTFYERLAEIVGEYVKKGSSIYVEGRLKYGKYIDRESGVEKNSTDIIATEMQLLGGRDQGQSRDDGYGQQGQPARQQPQQQGRPQARPQGQQQGYSQQRQQPQRQAAQQPAGRAPSGFDDMDSDDIPF